MHSIKEEFEKYKKNSLALSWVTTKNWMKASDAMAPLNRSLNFKLMAYEKDTLQKDASILNGCNWRGRMCCYFFITKVII